MDTLSLTNVNTNLYVNGLNAIPSGSIMCFAGATAPQGWLFCDGNAISRTTYATLFSTIGTTYGSGNGSTTFNLPNLQDRFPMGKGTNTLGNAGGSNSVTLTTSQLPSHNHTGTTDISGNHTHTINDPGHTHTQVTNQDDYNEFGGNPPSFADDFGTSVTWSNINTSTTGITINSAGNHTHTFTTNSTGNGSAIDITNKYITLNYIIRC